MEQKKVERKILITNKLGIHARAAAKFVELTSKCDSKFIVKNAFIRNIFVSNSLFDSPILWNQ